jgi:hypothetical protein
MIIIIMCNVCNIYIPPQLKQTEEKNLRLKGTSPAPKGTSPAPIRIKISLKGKNGEY